MGCNCAACACAPTPVKPRVVRGMVEMKMETLLDGEAPVVEPTRTEVSPHVELLARVIALAADDCRRVVSAPAYSALTKRARVEGASAAAFFLSEDGRAMIMASGLGHEAIKLGNRLAKAALARLRLGEGDLTGSPEAWHRALDRLNLDEAIPLGRTVSGRQEEFAFAHAA